jgi:hypothetical protein
VTVDGRTKHEECGHGKPDREKRPAKDTGQTRGRGRSEQDAKCHNLGSRRCHFWGLTTIGPQSGVVEGILYRMAAVAASDSYANPSAWTMALSATLMQPA